MTRPKSATDSTKNLINVEDQAVAAMPVQTKVQTKPLPVEAPDDISEASESDDIADTADQDLAHDSASEPEAAHSKPNSRWKWIAARGVLPGLALLLALVAGYLKFQDASMRDSQTARSQSVQAAIESTTTMLSYRPDNVDKALVTAQDRMTGKFKESYAALIHDVVIPGAKQKQISAAATVPAAASVSASEQHAVVVVFVNQTINIGNDPPSSTASSVRVTLEKINGRWLIAQFEPI
ncbi:hypothetical protein AAHS21_30585 [Mycobacterium sp. 050272]|uniref:hypothetical protein n=1 Tax=Mycobacterium sp. 050272 TaxID=3142488 RepID=UPI003198F945